MPAALLALLASLLQSASPQIIGIVTEWLSKYREALGNEDPELVMELEKLLASGDLAELSVFSVVLHNRVKAHAPVQPDDLPCFTDELHQRGQAVAPGAAPAVPSSGQSHG